MIGTVRRLLRRGFEQWVNIRDLLKLQDVVKKCLCSFSCYKLHYAVEKSLDNQQHRLLHIWKQRMEWYRDGEQTAAAGELQRFGVEAWPVSASKPGEVHCCSLHSKGG